jgi:hypothetical protein
MIVGQNFYCNHNSFENVQKGFFCESRPQLGEDGRSEKSPLVHTSKSVHAFKDVIDHKTVEIQWFRLSEKSREYCPVDSPENFLFERFKLQNTARQILQNALHPRGDDFRWQVHFCLRCLMQMAPDVLLMLSKKFGKAFYKNLITCASVWTCLCCAAKISSRRADEIGVAGDTHIAAGGAMYMLTYTTRHSRQDSLIELLGSSERHFGLRAALRILKNSRGYKRLLVTFGFVGLIRSLETTHSFANGWHPHVHELLLFNRALSRDELRVFERELFLFWLKACVKAELASPNRKHGVNVVRAFSPAEYLQKFGRDQNWGTGAELTRSHVKQSRDRKGRTPFDLLRIAAETQDYRGYEAKLFIEYSIAFYGVRQCFWSRGLKQVFGIGEVSDKQLVEHEDDQAELISRISPEMWRKVIKAPYDQRALLLRVAETGGREAVERFLAVL